MKYLIEVHHGIGDVVQMLGVLTAIYEKDPYAVIDVIVGASDRKQILQNDNRIRNIFILNLRNKAHRHLVGTIISLRKEKYDYALFSPISNKRDTNLLALMINAQRSIGEQFRELSYLSSRFVYVKKENVHIVKRNANLIISIGITNRVPVPYLKIKSLKRDNDKSKVIGICIGTSKPQKTWDIYRFIELAEHFTNKDFNIMFIGGKKEADIFPVGLFENNKRWHNFLGKTDLQGSATLVATCDVVIGCDTGMMHIAAAVQVPTITIFSCSNPLFHAPYSDKSLYLTAKLGCQYCYGTPAMARCKDFKCLSEISTDKVIEVVQLALEGKFESKYLFKL